MTCHVRKWMHNKSFPETERQRITGILYEWGFRDVTKVRYKPTTDTIVVWPRPGSGLSTLFIKNRGELMECPQPLTLRYF